MDMQRLKQKRLKEKEMHYIACVEAMRANEQRQRKFARRQLRRRVNCQELTVPMNASTHVPMYYDTDYITRAQSEYSQLQIRACSSCEQRVSQAAEINCRSNSLGATKVDLSLIHI